MAAEKKPKAELLARDRDGVLAYGGDYPAALHIPLMRLMRVLPSFRGDGRLLWLPDPPKPRAKRGKR